MVENLYCSNTTGSILYLQPTDREIAMANRLSVYSPGSQDPSRLGAENSKSQRKDAI